MFVGTNTVKRAGTLQRVQEAGRLDDRDQRGVIGRVDGVVDDVLVGKHLRAADDRILRRGGDGTGRQNGRRDGLRTEGLRH